MEEKSLIGKKIGNYRITVEINRGAFGSVYKAEHAYLKEHVVAIKVLHAYMEALQERMQFTQEAQFLAMLEHPHILPLLDFGISEQRPYFITRYAAGGSLRDLLKAEKSLSIEKAISILTQVGQALHYAHQQNVIHRDLKPGNILFNAQGEALLADFGIATTLSTTSIKQTTIINGTPQYMAPEQFRGLISKEGDQYALGCIAYELMTGRTPFSAPDFVSLGFRHLSEKPVPPSQYNPSIPVATEAAILKAMAKQRHERHASLPLFLSTLMAPFTQPSPRKIPPPAPGRSSVERSPSPIPSSQTAPHPILPAIFSMAPTSPVPSSAASPVRGEERSRPGRPVTREATHSQAFSDPKAQPTPAHALNSAAYPLQGTPHPSLRYSQKAGTPVQIPTRSPAEEAQAYYHRGIAFSTLNRYEEALEAFTQAILLDPQQALAHLNKGIALNALNRSNEAIQAYYEAIRLDPQHALAHYNLGVLLHERGQHKEAINAFDQAIRLDPTYASAYYGKGAALEQSGKRKEARQAYKKAEQFRSFR